MDIISWKRDFCLKNQNIFHCSISSVQVIHRVTLPLHCPWYNSSVDTLNNYLDMVLQPSTFPEFWWHKGLHKPNISILKRDAIHLNDQGNYALYQNYRGAILFALQGIKLKKELARWLLQTGWMYQAFTFALLVSPLIFNSLILSGPFFILYPAI